MTTALIVLACALAVALFVVAALANDRPPHSDSYLDDRAEDLARYGDNLERLVALYSDKITAVAERKVEEMALIVRAAHHDRDRLLTAVLALTDPRAAVVVGRVDEAVTRAQASAGGRMTMETFLAETREAAGRDTEFETAEGEPIHPVGMGG